MIKNPALAGPGLKRDKKKAETMTKKPQGRFLVKRNLDKSNKAKTPSKYSNFKLSPTPPDLLKLLNRCDQELPESCIICGDVPYAVGVFFPQDSQQYGAPTNKYRTLIYGLCKKCCAERPFRTVEKIARYELKQAGFMTLTAQEA